MTNEQLAVDAAKIGILQAEVKRRSMIFDCGEKERIAQAKGLHFSHYHKYSFKRWMKVKQAHYNRPEK